MVIRNVIWVIIGYRTIPYINKISNYDINVATNKSNMVWGRSSVISKKENISKLKFK